jgi:hypothetical protein
MGSVVRKQNKESEWTRLQVPYCLQAYNQRYSGVDNFMQRVKKASSFSHVRTLRHPRKQANFFKCINKQNSFSCFKQEMWDRCTTVAERKKALRYSMTKFTKNLIHQWCDHFNFRREQAPLFGAQSPLFGALGMLAAAALGSQSAERPRVSPVEIHVIAPHKVVTIDSRGRKHAKQRKSATVIVVSAQAAVVDHSIPNHVQAMHKHEATPWGPVQHKDGQPDKPVKRMSRNCYPCEQGVGLRCQYVGHKVRSQVSMWCKECEVFMHKECYRRYHKHAGFSRIY